MARRQLVAKRCGHLAPWPFSSRISTGKRPVGPIRTNSHRKGYFLVKCQTTRLACAFRIACPVPWPDRPYFEAAISVPGQPNTALLDCLQSQE